MSSMLRSFKKIKIKKFPKFWKSKKDWKGNRASKSSAKNWNDRNDVSRYTEHDLEKALESFRLCVCREKTATMQFLFFYFGMILIHKINIDIYRSMEIQQFINSIANSSRGHSFCFFVQLNYG